MFFKAKTRMAHVNNKRQDEENVYNSWNFAEDYEKIRGRNSKSRLGRRKIGETHTKDVKISGLKNSGIPVRPSGFSIGKNTAQTNLKINVQSVLNMPFNLYNYKQRTDNHGFKDIIKLNEKPKVEESITSILNKNFADSPSSPDEFMTCVHEPINMSKFQSSFCLLKTPGKQLTSRRSDDSPLDPLAGLSDDDDVEKTIFSVKSEIKNKTEKIFSPKNAEFDEHQKSETSQANFLAKTSPVVLNVSNDHKKDEIFAPCNTEEEHKISYADDKKPSDSLNIEKLDFFKQNTNLSHIKDQICTPSQDPDKKTSDTPNIQRLNFFKQNPNLDKKDQFLTPSIEPDKNTSQTPNFEKLNFFKQNQNLHKKDQILTPSQESDKKSSNTPNFFKQNQNLHKKDQILTPSQESDKKSSNTPNFEKLNFFKQNQNLYKNNQITPSQELDKKTSQIPNFEKLNYFKQNPNLHKKDQILTPSQEPDKKTSQTPNFEKLNYFKQNPNLHKKDQILTPSQEPDKKISQTPNSEKLNFFKQNQNLHKKDQILTPSQELDKKLLQTPNFEDQNFFRQNTNLSHKKEQILIQSQDTNKKTSDTPNIQRLNFFKQPNLHKKDQFLTPSQESHKKTSNTPSIEKHIFSKPNTNLHKNDQILTLSQESFKKTSTPNIQKLNFLKSNPNLPHKDQILTQPEKKDTPNIPKLNFLTQNTNIQQIFTPFENDEPTIITRGSEQINSSQNITFKEHKNIFTPSPYTFEKSIFQDNEQTLITPNTQKNERNPHKNDIFKENLFKLNITNNKKPENPSKSILTPPYTQKITERSNFTQCDFRFEPVYFNKKTRDEENILYVNKKPYIVLTMLGKGGSSKVYKVLDEQHNTVAVKCVDLDNVEDVIANGYLKEIKLLSQLQDCDIAIRMYDYEFVHETKKLNIVLEIGEIDFSKLLKDIETTKNISVAMIIYYWSEMLAAVQEIHKRGIIHSDLKPANFLIVKGRLKLIDFGTSSSLNGDMTSVFKEITTGTYNYMSPEAISYSGEIAGYKITYKSDIWSLGCILYNLLYGQTPFSHIKNTFAKLRAIADPRSKIIFPDDQKTPVHIIIAMRLCFVRDPKLRPSASELIQILELPISKSSLTRQIDMLIFEELKHAFPNLSREITQLENEIKEKKC